MGVLGCQTLRLSGRLTNLGGLRKGLVGSVFGRHRTLSGGINTGLMPLYIFPRRINLGALRVRLLGYLIDLGLNGSGGFLDVFLRGTAAGERNVCSRRPHSQESQAAHHCCGENRQRHRGPEEEKRI